MVRKILSIIIILVIVALLAGTCFFGYKFFSEKQETNQEGEQIQNLAEIVFAPNNTKQKDPILTENDLEESVFGTDPSVTEKQEEIDPYDYSVLKNINEECIGWVRIPDTDIDFPVMWRQGDNTYYLNHDINKQYSRHGTPFLDGNMTPEGQLAIHGHNMSDGHFFAPLLQYRNKEFWEQHPIITFYLYEQKLQFEVFAVTSFNSFADYTPYEIPISEYPEKVQSYIEKMQGRSLYQMDVDIDPTDRILVLSTCEYSHQNGRFIVIAHQITPNEKDDVPRDT